MKRRIAVFFGGRSSEHDVSVITGIQVLNAVDQSKFDAFPVYVSTSGVWLVGEKLAKISTYLPDNATLSELSIASLDCNVQGRGVLNIQAKGIFSRSKNLEFDVAVLAFHGSIGEDGPFQGLFEVAGVPYTGMRVLPSAISMDKIMTKQALVGLGIDVLPHVIIDRPKTGLLPPVQAINAAADAISFPCCVKPVHLGSSIGVAKAEDLDHLRAILPSIFMLDTCAMIEPFVQNLVEYNIAVGSFAGNIITSAIEKPKTTAELLDFRQKYASGRPGSKILGETSQGMLSLTREINPMMSDDLERKIRRWAVEAFRAVGGSGVPRIDFLCNSKTEELWFNEINPCPGSFAYFLWEAASEPILFTELISALIDQALSGPKRYNFSDDPVPEEARLLKRS